MPDHASTGSSASNADMKEGKYFLGDHVESIPTDQCMSPEEERHLVRKMDIRIIPILMLLYVMAFLDRVNIGNARLFNLEKDLGLHGNDYQLCVSLLFVTYVTFEFPYMILLKKIGPRNFIPIAATCWGTVSLCTGFVQNKSQLIAVRVLLGLAEAGFFPGITFFMTFWYRRRELGLRIFYLFTASAISGSCGGLLAFAIGHMDGIRGYSAWRWLMILEGIPTILLGIAAYFLLANDPISSTWLTSREKELVWIRRELDRNSMSLDEESDSIQWDQVIEGFKDWKIWVTALGQIGVTVMLYGYSTFLPTIIEALGYSGIHTQLLTIPCYACGAIVYCIAAWFSDRLGQRGIFAVSACVVSCVGYAVLLGTPQYGAGAQYAGCIIVAVGLYVAVGTPMSWMPNNLPSHYKRAVGQAMLFTWSNCGGIISSYIYRTQDKPRYTMGHAIMLGFIFTSMCSYGMVSVLLKRENKKRDRGERDRVLVGKTEYEVARLGDLHPSYRYVI